MASSGSASGKWIDFKRIEVGKKLGEGAYGAVYEAILDGNKEVAVKKLKDPDQKTVEREITQLFQLNHPNIIKICGASKNGEDIYVVMELADNGSLDDAVHRSSSKPGFSEAISWGLQCASGVAYLHSQHIIHRDLKPDNCLLFQNKKVLKICDFGVAREVTPSAEMVQYLTQIGTIGYVAPEVRKGPHYTNKCDVYSWAIMMRELLTFKKPDMDTNAKKRVPGVPDGLNNLLERCWAEDPSTRPSMSEVEKAMKAF